MSKQHPAFTIILTLKEYGLGDPCELKVIALRMVQLRAGIAMQGAHKHALGRVNVCAVAFPRTPVALGQSQFNPVGRAIHTTMKSSGIDKGFQQEQPMTEALLPVGGYPAFGEREHP